MNIFFKVIISILVFFFGGAIQADEYQLSETDRQYMKMVEQYKSKCNKADASKIPVTLGDMFCHSNPKNQISAAYCLLRNLEMPGNHDSIKFENTTETKKDGRYQNITITIAILCDKFNISKHEMDS